MTSKVKTNQQRSDQAYRTVLANASYADLQSQDTETQIRDLLKSMFVLCDEYGVDIDEELKQFEACKTDTTISEDS